MIMIKVGVIGCGKIAITRHLPEYASNPDAEIAGVYDFNLERAKEVAEQYQTRAYESVEEMLNDPQIEAVSVCVRNSDHSKVTVDALRAGKHVLCEKPMAVSLDECKEMVKTAEKTGKKRKGMSRRRGWPDQYQWRQCTGAGDLVPDDHHHLAAFSAGDDDFLHPLRHLPFVFAHGDGHPADAAQPGAGGHRPVPHLVHHGACALADQDPGL